MFFPLSLMGSHVGPSPSPITQRQLSMHFRAGVALFGQMGLELDLRQLDEEDKMILKAAIGIHKEFRELFHGGRLLRISTNNEALCFAVFANDNKRAVYAYIQLQSSKQSIPGRLLFTGLSNDKHYFCKVIWPLEFHQLHQSAFEGLGDQTISGQLLSQVGIQLPKLQPETITVFHVCQQ